MLFAIQQYEREDTEEFAPFTSKFDAFLAGRVQFSAQELRGYSLFNDPTLRNIAVTAPYFHNGEFATLRAALEFYVQRDTNPEKFYPLDAGGQAQKFNDLPDQYKANVNTTEVPYNRHAGDVPALGDSDIDDVIAFLNTLTDGLQP